jgi:hypothetical protein
MQLYVLLTLVLLDMSCIQTSMSVGVDQFGMWELLSRWVTGINHHNSLIYGMTLSIPSASTCSAKYLSQHQYLKWSLDWYLLNLLTIRFCHNSTKSKMHNILSFTSILTTGFIKFITSMNNNNYLFFHIEMCPSVCQIFVNVIIT